MLCCQWLIGKSIEFMVSNGESRGDACGAQAIRKQGLESCQIGCVGCVGCVAAEDYHLGGWVHGEDGIHDGIKNTRVDDIVFVTALGIRHPNETLCLVGMYGIYPADNRKKKRE